MSLSYSSINTKEFIEKYKDIYELEFPILFEGHSENWDYSYSYMKDSGYVYTWEQLWAIAYNENKYHTKSGTFYYKIFIHEPTNRKLLKFCWLWK